MLDVMGGMWLFKEPECIRIHIDTLILYGYLAEKLISYSLYTYMIPYL